VNREPPENKQLQLSRLSAGITAEISDLIGGRSFRNNVLGLGLNIGAKLRVERTTSSSNGCIIISVGASRLVIGHGMAEKIIVCSRETE
jgi:ferrous iron transport protein A